MGFNNIRFEPEPVSKDTEVCLSQAHAIIEKSVIKDLSYCGIDEFSPLEEIRDFLIFDSSMTENDTLIIWEEYDQSGIMFYYDVKSMTWYRSGITGGNRFTK